MPAGEADAGRELQGAGLGAMGKERPGQEQQPGHPYSFPPRQPAGGSQATEPRPSLRAWTPRGRPRRALTQVSPGSRPRGNWHSLLELQSFYLPTETTGAPRARRLLRTAGAKPREVLPVTSSPLMGADTSGFGHRHPQAFSTGRKAARAPSVFTLLCCDNEAGGSCSPHPTPSHELSLVHSGYLQIFFNFLCTQLCHLHLKLHCFFFHCNLYSFYFFFFSYSAS